MGLGVLEEKIKLSTKEKKALQTAILFYDSVMTRMGKWSGDTKSLKSAFEKLQGSDFESKKRQLLDFQWMVEAPAFDPFERERLERILNS
ncbi:MAG: hypothetical protein ACE5KZ_15460 [Candidatus Scalinduaceae bacterium]